MNNYGKEKLDKSRRRFGAIAMSTMIQPSEDLHVQLRDLLNDLRSAMDWLEDTPDFDNAHEMLDRAGRLAREYYPRGCVVPYHDESYWVDCPVDLAHNRIGLSTGFLVYAWECSICGKNSEECSHISGRIYDGKRCRHTPIDGCATDISLVSRPNQPDCRLTSISVSDEGFQRRFGSRYKSGVPITCDQCLSLCDGVSRALEEAYPNEHTIKLSLP